MEYLKSALDEIFGQQGCHEKDLIIEAVKMDNKEGGTVNGKVSEIIPMINKTFGKSHRLMSQKVANRYKTLLKTYSLEEIQKAFNNAKANDYHQQTKFFYCTPEYFSRPEQMDKWATFNPRQTDIFSETDNNFSSPIL